MRHLKTHHILSSNEFGSWDQDPCLQALCGRAVDRGQGGLGSCVLSLGLHPVQVISFLGTAIVLLG